MLSVRINLQLHDIFELQFVINSNCGGFANIFVMSETALSQTFIFNNIFIKSIILS